MGVEIGALVLFAVLVIYLYFRYEFSYWRRLNVPQLDPVFPFGDMASAIFRRANMAEKIKEIYDKTRARGCRYVGLYFFSRKAFLPIDPVLIKRILGPDFHYFEDRGLYYDEENDPISAHLFSLAGPKWRNLRMQLTPAFSPGKIKFMFDTIRECGVRMMEGLERSKTVEIREILARYSTDVIGSCAFGISCNSLSDPEAEFRRMGKRAFTQTIPDLVKIVIIRSFPSIARCLKLGIFSGNVTSFFREVVRETIEFRERNDVHRADFMQLLIELKNRGCLDGEKSTGRSLTVDEAAAQAFIFFLAGFETTSATISFALFELAQDEGIQEAARGEITRVLGKFQQLSYEAIMEMEYLDLIVSETLRKHPPAPIFLRKCTKTYRVPDTDIVIEKGMTTLIPAHSLHWDAEYYPNPENFNPNRFAPKNREKIPDYTYIPFGDGPRICIGMRFAMVQVKIALALILHKYRVTLNRRTILPLAMEKKGIIMAPIGGIWLDLS